MHQIPSDPSIAVVTAVFDPFTTDSLFDHFTQAELIVKWWPEAAEIDLRPGGKYVLRWPNQDWTLRGEYLEVEPGNHLAFTWAWDHEGTGANPQRVDIWFDCIHEHGARIGIFHGPFDLSEAGQAGRQGVIEGWTHFCMRLGGLQVGEVS